MSFNVYRELSIYSPKKSGVTTQQSSCRTSSKLVLPNYKVTPMPTVSVGTPSPAASYSCKWIIPVTFYPKLWAHIVTPKILRQWHEPLRPGIYAGTVICIISNYYKSRFVTIRSQILTRIVSCLAFNG